MPLVRDRFLVVFLVRKRALRIEHVLLRNAMQSPQSAGPVPYLYGRSHTPPSPHALSCGRMPIRVRTPVIMRAIRRAAQRRACTWERASAAVARPAGPDRRRQRSAARAGGRAGGHRSRAALCSALLGYRRHSLRPHRMRGRFRRRGRGRGAAMLSRVCVCVRGCTSCACVRACTSCACVRACVRVCAYVRACVRACD